MTEKSGFVIVKLLPLILILGAIVLTAFLLGQKTGFFNRAAPLTGPTPSIWGQAAHLENDYFSNNFIAIPRNNNIGAFNNNFTLEFWAKIDKFQNDFQSTLFHAGYDLNLYVDQKITNGVNQSILMLATSNGITNSYISGPNLNLNKWHHLSVAYEKQSTNSGTIILGVDGRNISKSNMPLIDRTYIFNWGERLIGGDIDEFRLSNVTRYSTQSGTYSMPSSPFINDSQTLLLFHVNNDLSDSSKFQNNAVFNNSLGKFVESTIPYIGYTVTPTPTPPPTAINFYVDFDAIPTSGKDPLTVKFTNLSSSVVVPIKSYEWNFGDGTKSFKRNPPNHTYKLKGSKTKKFLVVLKVTTIDNKSGKSSEAITVNPKKR